MVLQSYYAPVMGLILFAVFLASDQLLTRREKHLFACELVVVGTLLLTTTIDICTAQVVEGDFYWRVRALTSTLQFAIAPMVPLFLVLLCHPEHRIKKPWFLLPAGINFLLAITSLHTGLITRITPQNQYSRGVLFFVPFVAAGVYLLWTLAILSRNNSPGRRLESWAMVAVIAVMVGANGIETTLRLHCIIWSTTTVCLILLFFVMTITKVLYDPLTGAYSRLAYQKQLESVRGNRLGVLAMVDLNGLKTINDRFGHAAGDQAIRQVAQALLAIRLGSLRVYRYGGDEFVLIGLGNIAGRLERELEDALIRCGTVEGVPVSFAYGVRQGLGKNLAALLEEVDQQMYLNKAQNRGIRALRRESGTEKGRA